MALNVDLGELVAVAARAAEMSRTTGSGVPREWVLPAGADPISAQAIPRLNAHAAGLFNGVLNVMNEVQKLSHNVGAAAVEYAATDAEGARTLAAAGGGPEVSNPVPVAEQAGYRRVPEPLSNMTSTGGDPLVFAQQLHSGPGPGPAHRFADSVRSFTDAMVPAARGEMDNAAATMANWTPVGSEVATKLSTYRGWLDELGTGLGLLAESATTYGNAFANAKAKHPTPEEIIATRKKLVRAMRSKDEVGTQAALAEYQEQNTRSAETVGSYATETGTSADGNESGGGGAGAGGDSSALMQMMPMLMNMMSAGMDGLSPTDEISDDYYDDYYDDYGLGGTGIPSLGSSPGSTSAAGIPSEGDVSAVPVGAMTTASTAGMTNGAGPGGMPRAPIAESAGPNSSGAGTPMGRGGMMPMMPMAPGAGGAGGGGSGNERNRIVAWHPDRLMYVDDTPHTEQVIGERPTIAPSVTSPTPPPPNQAPTRSGGTA